MPLDTKWTQLMGWTKASSPSRSRSRTQDFVFMRFVGTCKLKYFVAQMTTHDA